jgi:hypothetical protein
MLRRQQVCPPIPGNGIATHVGLQGLPGPKLIAPTEMPPFKGMAQKPGSAHDLEQQLAVGVRLGVTFGKVIGI